MLTVPVAIKFEIVPELQTVCAPDPDGADGLFMLTVTFNLFTLSHDKPDAVVWVAK